jgi:phosphoribosylformylglycinamidine synthase
MVMADTVVRPGSDAGVVRVHGTEKALAFTSDVTPRYCKANPVEGGKQAVAEAYRNLCATGAKPLATTDNLNFGNPEKPEIMGQFVGCVQGIGEACAALDMPIVSGNVSLYNETDGVGILPTPTIGAVGLLSSLDELIGIAPEAGDALILIGDNRGHLGQSALLAEVFGREEGDAPPVDLAAERGAGELVRAAKAAGFLSAAHDLSDGGLALAAADMALAGNVGISLATGDTGWFFGEDQGRYLLATKEASMVIAMAESAGVPAQNVGRAQGSILELGKARIPLEDLRKAYESGLPDLMD